MKAGPVEDRALRNFAIAAALLVVAKLVESCGGMASTHPWRLQLYFLALAVGAAGFFFLLKFLSAAWLLTPWGRPKPAFDADEVFTRHMAKRPFDNER